VTSTEAPAAGAVTRALAVVDAGLRAVEAYGRPDLGERLAATQQRLRDPAVTVLVVGEFKQGKSSLVNALVGEPICPVDDDIATSAPTLVRYGAEARAVVVTDGADGGDPVRTDIALDELPAYVSEAGNPRNERGIRVVEVSIPCDLLAGGLSFVDTPGVGGLGSRHGAITMSALPLADALLFVTDASQELTAPELEFVRQARERCPNVFGVMTKTDYYPEWRRVRELDLERLFAARTTMPLVGVSSMLRQLEPDLDEESGFAELLALLHDEVVTEAEDLEVRAAAADLLAVASHLEAAFSAQRETLSDPARAAELIAGLEATKERVTKLRGDAARWMVTLNDGVADLSADADHDLRSRIRTLLRDAEATIDEADPAEMWPEFERWLYARVGWDVSEAYTFVSRRTAELVDLIAEHFREALGEVDLAVDVAAPIVSAERLGVDATAEFEHTKLRDKGLSAMRGAYGGTLMFGMVTSMVGLGALAPLTLPVGLLMGRKALREEQDRRLMVRRQEAKQALRRYVDEAQFAVGKDQRDTLRRVQRELRDRFQERALELERTLGEALEAAQQAAVTSETERGARLRDVESELERIGVLQQAAAALAPSLPAARAARRRG
jgi:hypothetical protein